MEVELREMEQTRRGIAVDDIEKRYGLVIRVEQRFKKGIAESEQHRTNQMWSEADWIKIKQRAVNIFLVKKVM